MNSRESERSRPSNKDGGPRQKVVQFGTRKPPLGDSNRPRPVRESIINQLPNLSLGGISTELTKLNVNQTELDPKVSNKLYDLQDRFVGSYTDDFNILEVHECILKHFSLGKGRKLQQLERIVEVEKRKVKQPQTVIDRKRSQKLIEATEKEIEDIKTDAGLKRYLDEVELYISSYRQLGPIPKVVVFKNEAAKARTEETEDDKISARYRHMLISRYLEIARRYIQIDVIREVGTEKICEACGENLENATIDDAGTLYCPCGVIRDTISRQPAYKDTVRISSSSRNNYEDKENFVKSFMRFQGKQSNRFGSGLFDTLDAYFKSYGLMTGEEVKKRPLDDRGRRVGTDKAMMYKALKETGNESLYEDINLLLHLYWGWTLPDISHLEEAILEDYEKSQRVYETIKNERSSCLNTQYRLFKHLQLLGYPCKTDDFKIIGTRDILEYHEMIWEKICKELGWPFIKTI